MDHFRRPIDRDLTFEERALLSWLIAHGKPEAAKFAGQIPRVRVVAECTCGCPTIDLALDEEPVSRAGASFIISDLDGRSPDGVEVGMIVHVRSGGLSELEVFSKTPMVGTFGLPKPENLVAQVKRGN